MAIGAVSAENAIPGDVPAAQQTTASESTGFSDVLSRTAMSSGSFDLDAIFEEAARRYNLPVNLIKAVARVESNFRPDVTSHAGAMGIMQLMPGTARGLGVTDPYDPEQSIMGGAKYLKQMLDQFGSVELALAAYNAGPNNVKKYGGIPPFTETQTYVKRVMEYMGSDITAGMVSYNGFLGKAGAQGAFGSKSLGEAFTQMMLMKIIEMQMNSSGEDKKKVF